MKTARLLLAMIALSALDAQAKESETSARLQPRGAAAAGAEAGSVQMPPPAGPRASADAPGETGLAGDAPLSSSEPPRRALATQNSLSGSGNLFRFRVCNRSRDGARVAVTRRGDGGEGWMVEGWWRIAPSACEDLGLFQRGWIYYFAEATDGSAWSGDALHKCVGYPGNFSRLDDVGGGKYECRKGERLKGFRSWHVAQEVARHTWNLDP